MSKLRKIMAMVLSCMMLFSVTAFAGGAIVNNLTNVKITVYNGTPDEGAERVWAFIPDYTDEKKANTFGHFTVTEADENVYLYCDVFGVQGTANYDLTIVEYVMNGNECIESTVAAFEGIDIRNIVSIAGLLPGKNYYFTVQSKIASGNASFYFWSSGAKLTYENRPIEIIDNGFSNQALKRIPSDDVVVIWTENPDNEAMYELQKYGIIEGDPNGDIRPYTTITRAEMAKVLCKALGLPKMDNGKSAFSDMTSAHWAYGYIETAYASGLIDGNGDGTFAPDNDVKFSEAVKMIVTALGYKPMAEQRGGFPHGYAQIASQNGVTKDIDHALDVPCNRNIVFKMLYNALDVPCVIQTGFGSNAEYAIANGENGTPYKTLRTLITGTEIIPGQKYDKDYIDELNKFMEGGEYYDEIAAELEEFWKPEGFNGSYTFEIVYAELNSDATDISLKIKITPDNGEVCYVHLGYAKVDGKWKF